MRRRPFDERLKAYYRRYRNKLNTDLRFTKDQYYAIKFENCNGNPKDQWKLVNSLIGETKDRSSISELLVGEEKIIDKQGIASEFISFFLSTAENIRSTIDYASVIKNANYDNIFPINSSDRSMFMRPTDEDEVTNLIKGLNLLIPIT